VKSAKAGSIPIASTVFFAVCMLPLGLRQDFASIASGKFLVGIGNASIAGTVPRGMIQIKAEWRRPSIVNDS
jgi:Cys-tRNA synthase (O-phospho-L-seryl-tRNA:Cys-tRNA synthase)